MSESTSSHPTPTHMASAVQPREQVDQIRAITTLLRLAQEDAPTVQWKVYDDRQLNRTMLPHLDGHLFVQGDRKRLQGLAAWQRVIGAGPVQADPVGVREHHTIRGSYEGLAVEVTTTVDAPSYCCSGCQGHGDAA